jgi:beta-glucosidase
LNSAVQARAIDLSAQEDARQFSSTDRASMAIDGPAVHLLRHVDGGFELRLDWRIDAYSGDALDIGFAGGMLNISSIVRAATIGAATETRIPLSCFRDAGGAFRPKFDHVESRD